MLYSARDCGSTQSTESLLQEAGPGRADCAVLLTVNQIGRSGIEKNEEENAEI